METLQDQGYFYVISMIELTDPQLVSLCTHLETLTLGTEEDLAELESRESLLNKRRRKSYEEEEYKEAGSAAKKRQKVSKERYVAKQESKPRGKVLQELTMRQLLTDRQTS
jgi:hypothetical protein